MKALPVHSVSLAIWDVPDLIYPGEALTVKIGARCSRGCSLDGSDVFVGDQEGNELARAVLGAASATSNTSLQCAIVEFAAPVKTGVHKLTAILQYLLRESAEDTPRHVGKPHDFSLVVTDTGTIAVIAAVVEQGSQTPLPGVHIMMRPYRGYTDNLGQLTFVAAPGDYVLYATKDRYEDYSCPLEISTNLTISIELKPSVYEEDYRGCLQRVI